MNRDLNPLIEAEPGMPVELAEEVFSEFLVNAKQDVVDQHDCEFIMELCILVGQELEDEHVRVIRFTDMLSKYLGSELPIKVASITCPLTTSLLPNDGCVLVLNHMALLGELKLDPHAALFQAMQFYANHLAELQENKRENSFWPCFLVELFGTCVRISSLLYFENVAFQPLTPFFHCYINDFDHSDMNTLCRTMRALRTGVHKLCNTGIAAVTRNKNVPYHICSPGLEFLQRIGNNLLFVMRVRESGERKVVKFCRHYDVSVHNAWAEQGLAPKLINCSQGRDGWYVIEMELLRPYEWKSVYAWSNAYQTTESRRQLLETISNALARAHQIQINGSKTVHGDMRNPNILVRESDDEVGRTSFEVKFLDFSWSGIDGQAVYPTFMNTDLKWHPDVGPGKPLHQEHDTHWLSALIDDY